MKHNTEYKIRAFQKFMFLQILRIFGELAKISIWPNFCDILQQNFTKKHNLTYYCTQIVTFKCLLKKKHEKDHKNYVKVILWHQSLTPTPLSFSMNLAFFLVFYKFLIKIEGVYLEQIVKSLQFLLLISCLQYLGLNSC